MDSSRRRDEAKRTTVTAHPRAGYALRSENVRVTVAVCHCSMSSVAGLGDTSETLLTEQWHTAALVAMILAHTYRK